MTKQYAVIGLGRFGGSICRTLSEQGQEVMAIDKSEEIVNEYKDLATYAIIANTTEQNMLKSLGIGNFDHVIVAIGDDIQASLLTTIMLKELDVKKVTAKAITEYHGRILYRIGADNVVHPERDMGKRVANHILSSSMLDYIELSDEYSVVEVLIGKSMIGQSLADLDVRANYGINILAIKREKEIDVSPEADKVLGEGDLMVIMGAEADIKRFRNNMLDND
ncbi:potassium channel family protein [Halobacillus naozhouensis]|uniref:TrkA family potassium uptake protein n=1 Tax=Halobacillus naozhouensis TaxID=554880 RepID=A0ABY8J1M8_9BACI|nr:TrkA family potassium uptake protein [Halobacillus naozhouensis]WFT75477.1 TrkA family potassium uptake protein [Halobacillus naozhouensis]